MRKIISSHLQLGEVPIEKIVFDLQSRDEIPKLLIGLQSIYCDVDARFKVFKIIKNLIPRNVSKNNGRNGMDLWKILVMGTLRLCCNWDYDKLTEIANNHKALRQLLGHGPMDEHRYALQTVKDNISLFTPEILAKLSKITVDYGYQVIGKAHDDYLSGSCDSFVVKTDVHYPTDINLLFDAMRRDIILVKRLSDQLGLPGWRQGDHHLKNVKKLFNKARKLKRSNSKDEIKKEKSEQAIIKAHLAYIELSESLIEKTKMTIDCTLSPSVIDQLRIIGIERFIAHAERQIDQIYRRAVNGETIPHHEKVFSLFEEHTEWISKGKAGVPQELGLRVCVVKDQYGFLLHHRVMEHETDDKIAVPIIKETKARFPNFRSCSFDKGFHSPDNQKDLSKILDRVVLPRKGRLSAINKEIEHSEEFIKARKKHSAIESSINALENHGLDRCRDHGIYGFKRYVGLAVLARNIQILGHIIQQKELKRQQKLERKKQYNII